MDYVFSPIVIVLLVVTALSVFFGLRQAKMLQSEGDVKSGSKRAPVTFLLVVTAYLVVAVINASLIPNYAFTDKVFPQVAGNHRDSDFIGQFRGDNHMRMLTRWLHMPLMHRPDGFLPLIIDRDL